MRQNSVHCNKTWHLQHLNCLLVRKWEIWTEFLFLVIMLFRKTANWISNRIVIVKGIYLRGRDTATSRDLSNMLLELYFPFSLIGFTEIKQKIGEFLISNTDLHGYQFLSQPSLSNAGGVAFYINNNLNFSTRPEFTTTTDDFEALWSDEVHHNFHSNLVCGIIHRHPNGDLERFIEYLSSTTDRINQENKTCIIMGDLNIDLLKLESYSATDSFLNTLGSYFFQPYINLLTAFSLYPAKV